MGAEGFLTPDQRLALAYAPAQQRGDFDVLFQVDHACRAAVSAASEPIIGQIRLAWWRDLIAAEAPPAIEYPLPLRVYELSQVRGIRSQILAMVNGWERLLSPLPLSVDDLEGYAAGRGGGLFECAAALASVDSETAGRAGEGWALADFAFRCSDHATADRALELAKTRLDARTGWPRPLLPFAILSRFARRDVACGIDRGSASGTPWRLYDALAAAIQGK